MYTSLAEGGKTPIVINEGSSDGDRSGFGAGGGVLIILLFLIIIAVVAIPFFSRNREPIAERNSVLSEILPAMMLMQSTGAGIAQRQTVDVNSHNTNTNGIGPSNFQLYQQGVATNDNVFVQSCQTRELVREDGQGTRDLVNDLENQRLRDENKLLQTRLLMNDNALVNERQTNALAAQITNIYNSLQGQIYSLGTQIPKVPVPAFAVNPYGSYRPGFVHALGGDGCHQ